MEQKTAQHALLTVEHAQNNNSHHNLVEEEAGAAEAQKQCYLRTRPHQPKVMLLERPPA
jgi:hypothetical protein